MNGGGTTRPQKRQVLQDLRGIDGLKGTCAIEKEPRFLHEAQAAIPRSSAQTEEVPMSQRGVSGSVGLVVCLLWLISQSVRELGSGQGRVCKRESLGKLRQIKAS